VGAPDSTKTSFTDKNVTSGIKYKYTVKAVNDKVKSTFTATPALVRLAQPTVKIVNAKTGITVKWNKIAGVTGYKIYRQELVNEKWSNWSGVYTAKASATSWTDTKAESGATYRYTVRAKNGKHLSSYTATESLMFLSMPTVKISNTSKGVKITWLESTGATGYTVYRSEYNAKTKKWSGWSNKDTVDSSKTVWIDKNVTSGVKYKYTVKAVNGIFKSAYTSSSKLVYLSQPVVTAAKTSSGIVVKWTKSAETESYTVYRQEMTDGPWSEWESLTTVKATENSYTDKTVDSGKTYRYTVRAANGKYKSSYEASNSVKR
jgi:fibronectin type 3 domain-containing protein